MHVDVGIVFACKFENALDLAGAVRVVAGRAADHPGAALHGLDQQFVGARVIDQPFLREHAHLDVDRPLVVLDQRRDGVEPAHADTRIHFDLGAHAGGAVQDAFLKGALGAHSGVFDRHAVLDRRDALDRAQRALVLRRAAVDDPRLVQVDVRFDQTGTGEAAPGVEGFGRCGQLRPDCGDAPVLDADVHRRMVCSETCETCVSDDQIHRIFSPKMRREYPICVTLGSRPDRSIANSLMENP
jgi:hypothetical protein